MTSPLLLVLLLGAAQHTGQMSPTSDVSSNRVTAAGASTSQALRDWAQTINTTALRFDGVVNVKEFGAACNGTTDDTTAFSAAIAAAMTLGKEMRLPASAACCKTTGQIALPNDGATPPRQKPLRIVGAGATMSGRGASVANGGSCWDATYNGTLYGKILTTGLGVLEVSGVTFTDSGGGTLPFIYTTNTTLKVHDNAFIGSKTGTDADQDAIVLGGVQPVEGQGSPEHGFQGYGTVIKDNHFHRIRRAVYGRTYANATVIRDNTVWSNCGTNLAGGAAIEFDSVGGGYATGNVITGNLIEVTGYPYAVKLGAATQNTITANNLFDATGIASAGVRFENDATFNFLHDGYLPPGLSGYDDLSNYGGLLNTKFSIGQTFPYQLGQGGVITIYASDVVHKYATSMPIAHYISSTGQEMFLKIGGTGANPAIDAWVIPTGTTVGYSPGGFKQLSETQGSVQLYGADGGFVESPNGDLKLRAKSGSTLWLGDVGGTPFYVQNSTKRLMVNDSAGEIRWGSVGGPAMVFGSGSPEGVRAYPVGSLYLRSDGGYGTAIYAKEVGTDSAGWRAGLFASSAGTITLSSGTPSTGTATVRSGAVCVCTNATTQANPIMCVVSTTTLTATGPNSVTDTVNYACF